MPALAIWSSLNVGNDMMIHAGDPVGFADLKSSKWSDKIYGFGRLPVD